MKAFYIICTIVIAGAAVFWRISKPQAVQTTPTPEIAAEEEVQPTPEQGTGSVDGTLYRHTKPTFSFHCPDACTPGSVHDDNGETILLKNFQIYITPQDEEFVVTKARIAQDAPGTIVDSPKTVSVDGAQALVFKSKNLAGAATREVWFTHAGYLYQISGYPDAEQAISVVVSTWKF